MRVTAAVTAGARASFELRELEAGELRPDEVLVEVAAAGICHAFFEHSFAASRPADGSSVFGDFHDFDEIERAAYDAENGRTVKAVPRIA